MNKIKAWVSGRSLYLSALSAVLLILAYPKIEWAWLAWLALVPLMFGLDGKRVRAAFGWAYLCGVIFFAGTVFWIGHVTVIGACLLVLYFALYFGAFGALYQLSQKFTKIERVLFLSASWSGLEFLRAHIFSGFDWVSLGHSQFKFLPVIQIADVTGVFGVSFVVMLVNVMIKEMISDRLARKAIDLRTYFVATGIVGAVFVYGLIQLAIKPVLPAREFAVVQPNIDHRLKWQELLWPDIVKKTMILTGGAAKRKPALVIWPETALPGIYENERGEYRGPENFIGGVVSFSDKTGVPLLVGAVTQEQEHYYNSALLISPRAGVARSYSKVHLVPFGEFIPFGRWFPFLKTIVPIDDFTPGKEHTVFRLPGNKNADLTFAVLICFEDTFADVARRSVKNGASLLINITNDSWFGDTKEPFLHMQSAVFRAVENRRMLVRCANTGVSSFIDRHGKIVKIFGGSINRMTYAAGFVNQDVEFGHGLTFYTRFGDVFVYLCACYAVIAIWRKKSF